VKNGITLFVCIVEGVLYIHERPRDRDRERFVFLFDNMMLMCKPSGPRKASAAQEYRFKEKYLLRNIDIVDVEDTDGKNMWWLGATQDFEIVG